MKKVLIVSYTNIFGGAEVVLCDYLDKNFYHDIYLYTTNSPQISLNYRKYLAKENFFVSPKMNMISMRKHPFIFIINIFYNLYKINKIIKTNSIEILYGNNTLDMLLIALYKRYINKNIKVISHIHDIIEKKRYITLVKEYYNSIDYFIVPSLATKKSLLNCGVEQKKIFVVHNGMSIKYNDFNKDFFRKKYRLEKSKKILCFIGQICKRKRPDLFIDIVNKLNQNTTQDYIGIIIGKIVERDYYEDIKSMMNQYIIYAGEFNREDIIKYVYPGIDIIVLTSDRDPLPTVLLEAMSSDTIVVARDVDGVKEIVDDGINGFIFPYTVNLDYIASLIKKVASFPENELVKIKLEAVKKIKDEFSLEKKIKKINDIIEKV